MTVTEIKKYIDRWLEWWNRQEERPKKRLYAVAINELNEIKDMLDELEPKAKWLETDLWEDGIGDIYKCSNCGNNHMDHMNYCSSCGARMNDELEENNK